MLITYNSINYDVKFTDLFLGQEKRNVFRESNVIKDLDAYFRNNKNEDDEDEQNSRKTTFNRKSYDYSTMPSKKQRKYN